MGQALYRKYRSKSLSEIVGQEHIITSLRNALKNGSISHAYLFTGPRGVGKTSIARILAHEINNLEYTDESVHLDIIEIDAASNRRIDEIRDLRDKVHIAPSSAKYKVYIIDEVHMLTKEAFNALLKTLEEPPAHVIFILATTEVHKLPETIVSRTQRFTFKPIDPPKAVEHMRHIAKEEKIDVSDEALRLLAEHGDGSFRDSISLLDQVSNINGRIEADDIRQLLGIAPQEAIQELFGLIWGGTPAQIVLRLHQQEEQGFEAGHIAKQLGKVLREALISNETHGQEAEYAHLLRQLINVPSSSDPSVYLEVTLLEANLASTPSAKPQTFTSEKTVKPEIEPPVAEVKPEPEKIVEKHDPKPKKAEKPIAKSEPVAQMPATSTKVTSDINEAWQLTLDDIKKQYNTLYGILRMAEPELSDNTVTLSFKFAFHQKRINDQKNKKLISDAFERHTGFPVTINCIVSEDAEPMTVAETAIISQPETPASPALNTISNIFGSAEVLE